MKTASPGSFKRITRRKRIETPDSNDPVEIDISNIFLEFISCRFRNDSENYTRAASFVHDLVGRETLLSLAEKKAEMLRFCILNRGHGCDDRFEYSFDSALRSSLVDFVMDTNFKMINCRYDAFLFAYRKEYESLAVFEKIQLLADNGTVLTFLETVIAHQQRCIILLDDKLYCTARKGPPEIAPKDPMGPVFDF